MGKRGPRCSICQHPERWRIELLRAGGASLDALAKKFDVDRTAVHRHWQHHVTPDAKAGYLAGPSQMDALAKRAADEGDSVIDYLRMTRTALMSAMAACSEAGDARGVAAVAGALIATLEKIGRLTGQIAAIAQGTTVNVNVAILNSPEFARIQAAQLAALAPFPDARAVVVAAWRELDAELAGPSPGSLTAIPAPPLTIEATASHVT